MAEVTGTGRVKRGMAEMLKGGVFEVEAGAFGGGAEEVCGPAVFDEQVRAMRGVRGSEKVFLGKESPEAGEVRFKRSFRSTFGCLRR